MARLKCKFKLKVWTDWYSWPNIQYGHCGRLKLCEHSTIYPTLVHVTFSHVLIVPIWLVNLGVRPASREASLCLDFLIALFVVLLHFMPSRHPVTWYHLVIQSLDTISSSSKTEYTRMFPDHSFYIEILIIIRAEIILLTRYNLPL